MKLEDVELDHLIVMHDIKTGYIRHFEVCYVDDMKCIVESTNPKLKIPVKNNNLRVFTDYYIIEYYDLSETEGYLYWYNNLRSKDKSHN